MITQRNIDIRALVQATHQRTFLFTLMQSDVPASSFTPADEAFSPLAIVRVPEMPGRDFPGK